MTEEKVFFSDMDEKEQEAYRKRTLRYEIMHAFLNESGLSDSSNQYGGAWAKNEEMVDWFAIQSPKIFLRYIRALIFWENNNGHRNNETTDKKIRTRSCGFCDAGSSGGTVLPE